MVRLRDLDPAVFLNKVGVGTSNPQGLVHLSKLTDPALVLTNETGNQHYLVGIDDSAENKPLVIANGQVVGTNTRISLDPTDGKTTFLGGVRVGNHNLSPSTTTTGTTKAGRVEYGWHRVCKQNTSAAQYLHIKTDLWGGGSPHGNNEYIMGGIHMAGYRYTAGAGAGTGRIADSWVMFHNWSGGYANLEILNNGTWDAGVSPYVSSDGYCVLVVNFGTSAATYGGLDIDFHQTFDAYEWRDISVTAESFSSSATGVY